MYAPRTITFASLFLWGTKCATIDKDSRDNKPDFGMLHQGLKTHNPQNVQIWHIFNLIGCFVRLYIHSTPKPPTFGAVFTSLLRCRLSFHVWVSILLRISVTFPYHQTYFLLFYFILVFLSQKLLKALCPWLLIKYCIRGGDGLNTYLYFFNKNKNVTIIYKYLIENLKNTNILVSINFVKWHVSFC